MTPSDNHNRRDVAIVTGPAGAGRSTAIHALEDFGFEAIDNLPLSFLERLFSSDTTTRPIVIGVDARTRDFSAAALWEALEALSAHPGLNVNLVFLDCATDTLLRRFSETRRRHPMAPSGTPLEGIERELEMLAPLRERADVLVDTTEMSPHDLRAELGRWFGQETVLGLSVSVQSFSYKRGTPRSADMVFDCRFLRNPHWEDHLRPLTGESQPVADYVVSDPNFAGFFDKVVDMTTSLLPAYRTEGKSYFTIAFGCTGGKHRSVATAKKVANALAEAGWQVSIRHRELERLPDGAGLKRMVSG
ncbi:RNase adapter RapZ [Algicella marina]|uniref:RNase adapter RapZ n=1 Tax=Algicella marina TaxID=2683284 RepID=A0A6P1T5L7_9RHOB|nr:RNase adapter RapZ [Algicella marina]QHQ37101.1 RNase adapter RapZ [Algicella marina]